RACGGTLRAPCRGVVFYRRPRRKHYDGQTTRDARASVQNGSETRRSPPGSRRRDRGSRDLKSENWKMVDSCISNSKFEVRDLRSNFSFRTSNFEFEMQESTIFTFQVSDLDVKNR